MKRIELKSCRGLFHLIEQGNVFLLMWSIKSGPLYSLWRHPEAGTSWALWAADHTPGTMTSINSNMAPFARIEALGGKGKLQQIRNECSEAWRKTLQIDCSTHKSIFAFTTCYPKIHLHAHSGMCRSQEWGLMRAGWPSHHCLHCFSCWILTVDSQECLTRYMPAACAYCRPLRHNKSKGGLIFQEALLSVLHLCPALPMGGSGLGLTERVQHINFSCIAESLFPTQPPPYLTQSPAPTPIFSCPRRMGQGAGHAAASRSTRHAGP